MFTICGSDSLFVALFVVYIARNCGVYIARNCGVYIARNCGVYIARNC